MDAITGEPVPYVDVIFKSWAVENTVNSGQSGDYAIALAPGKYRVRAVGERVFGPPGVQLSIGRISEFVKYDVPVYRAAEIQGRVIDATGNPVAQAEIQFIPGNPADRVYVRSQELVAHAVSGSDGRFSIDVLPGVALLKARSGERKGATRLTSVIPGGQVSDVTITVHDGMKVAGVVRRPDGSPAVGATVDSVSRVPGRGNVERHTVTVDPSGRFEVPNVPPGAVTLEARASGYGPSSLKTMTIEPGGRYRDVILSLNEARSIMGRVTDQDGEPLAGAVVKAVRKGVRMKPVQARTDDLGTFRLEPLDTGPYRLDVSLSGFASAQRQWLSAPAEDVAIELLSHGALRGEVRTESGQPITSFAVAIDGWIAPGSAHKRAGKRPARRVFSADGRFELGELAPGSYDITVTAAGFAPTRVMGISVPSGGHGDGSAVLRGGGTLTGKVRSTSDAPVSGARVVVSSSSANQLAVTDDAGKFTIADVAPGRRSLEVSHPEHVTAYRSAIEIRANAATHVDLSLDPRSGEGERESDLSGVGLVLHPATSELTIYAVLPGSPASRASLRRRDHITAIDGVATSAMPRRQAIELLRGVAGSEVSLEVTRAGRTMTVTVRRDRFRFPSTQRGPVVRVDRIQREEPQA